MKNKFYVLGIVLLIGLIINSCDDEQQNPTCQEACIQTQDNHLGRNDNGTLAVCDHNGKTIQGECECTEQTGILDGLTITKAANVTVDQMTTAVEKIQGAYADAAIFPAQQTKFKAKVTSIHVLLGSVVVLDENVLKIGIDALQGVIMDYMLDDIIALIP